MTETRDRAGAGAGLGRLQRLIGLVSAELSATMTHGHGETVVEITLGSAAETREFRKLRVARSLLAERRQARTNSGQHRDLFADPAWDILLDLYVNDGDDRCVSVSSACIAAGVPPTTALRWLGALERRSLVMRAEDPFDRRRSLMHLTAHGVDLVERMLPERIE